ncbi:MAG: hypothetical protein LUI87_05125 [Lachnospiraceae bacterium]|nr:hypothetical protein [Lachnospiraceae bacterium]
MDENETTGSADTELVNGTTGSAEMGSENGASGTSKSGVSSEMEQENLPESLTKLHRKEDDELTESMSRQLAEEPQPSQSSATAEPQPSQSAAPAEPPSSDLPHSEHQPEPEKRPDYLAEAERFEDEEKRENRDFLEAQRLRHEKWKKDKSRRRRKHVLIGGGILCGAAAVVGLVCFLILYFRSPILDEYTVEAGSANISAEAFLLDSDTDAEVAFVTDLSEISFDHVGTWTVTLSVNGREWNSSLEIRDTKAPEAEAVSAVLNVGGELEAGELVDDVSDATDVTIAYKEEPDFSEEGIMYPVVVLTDEGGNHTEITTMVEVLRDEEAPVIDGVVALNAYIDVPVSYKSNIVVTDDCDPDVELTVDTSDVDPDEEGTYEITYTATDWAGHTATASTTITFSEKPEDYVEESVVLEEAQEVLDEIVTEDMTLKQKAKAIYNWVRANISYTNSTYKESWTNGAHIGFTTGAGDCFIYFATTKALLTQAGIPNIDVEKSNTTRSHHYWSLVNVGDGWYHLDTTPRESGATFFLVTDEEMLSYFEKYGTYDAFDTSLYPATPTTASTIE